MMQGFRLSPQQRRIWLSQQNDINSVSFPCQAMIRLSGTVDKQALMTALYQVIETYEIFRTLFQCLPGTTIPLQLIADDVQPSMNTIDLTHLTERQQQAQLRNVFDETKAQAFDLEKGPLVRVVLFTLATNEYRLLLSLPALCADISTLQTIVSELGRAYAATLRETEQTGELDEEMLQYTDVAAWLNELLESEETAEGRSYWYKQRWSNALSVRVSFEKFGMKTSSALPFEPQSLTIPIDPKIVQPLRRMAQQLDSPLAAIVLACWQIQLWRLSGQTEIVVGVGCDGRNYEELQTTPGPLSKYVPVYTRLDAQLAFDTLATTVAETLDENYGWQEYFDWEVLANEFNIERSFFPYNFNFEQIPLPEVVEGISLSIDEQATLTERFNIQLTLIEQGETLTLRLAYNAHLFLSDSIRIMARQFCALLAAVAAQPDTPLGDLSMMDAQEHTRLLVEFNDTQTNYPVDHCFPQLFEQQVERTPQAIAVVYEGQQLTYQELNRRANQLAHYLRSLGIGSETLVGLHLERSLEMVVGLLGILKAGGAYVPLDTTYPADRLAFMVSDAQLSYVISYSSLSTIANGEGSVLESPDSSHAFLAEGQATLIDVEAIANELGRQSTHNPISQIKPDNLAYVIYTSGSTGQPKGTLIPHRGLSNYLAWCIDAYYAEAGDGAPVNTALGFDATITSLFSPLLLGQPVRLLPEAEEIDALAQALQGDSHFSLVKLTPAHLQALGQLGYPGQKTRAFIIGGEALFSHQLADWYQHYPNLRLVNEYGPTETVVGCCVYEASGDFTSREAVPIGRPVANMQLYILDEQLQPVSTGVMGELYVGGVQLARGYLDQPGLTAERFIPHPFASPTSSAAGTRLYKTGDLARYIFDSTGRLVIEFIGRRDHQVKIRGYRIELGEIESVLSQHPGVSKAVAAIHEDHLGRKRLVAYMVLKERSSANLESIDNNSGGLPINERLLYTELQQFLRKKLPDPMIPTTFMILDALPLTPNGKVDRQALPAPKQRSDHYVPPSTAVEKHLVDIWQAVLGVDRIGINDNFFELGGDSIISIQVVARAAQAGLHFSPRDLFQYRTIAELVAVVTPQASVQSEQARKTGASPLSSTQPSPLENVADRYSLSPLQQGILFETLVSSDTGVYIEQLCATLTGVLDVAAFQQAWEQLVARQAVLRTAFLWEGQETPVQVVYEQVDLHWTHHDWRDLSHAEQRAQLATFLEADRAQGFVLTQAPLMRFTLIQTAYDAFHFIWSHHHLLLDGWSMSTLFKELFVIYKATVQHIPVSLSVPWPYQNYITWLQQQDLAQAESFWRKTLQGFTSATPVGVDRRSALKTTQYVKETFHFSATTTTALQRFARDHNLTLNTLFQGAWALLLSRYSDQDDVLFGATVSGRPATLNGVEEMVGLFINTLPVRVQIAEKKVLLPWLEQIQSDQQERDQYSYVALTDIQRWSDLPQGVPLFNTLLLFENYPLDVSMLQMNSDLHLKSVRTLEQTNYLLTVWVVPGAELMIHVGYETGRFTPATIQRLVSHLRRLLERMVQAPQQTLGHLSLLSQAERQQLLVRWNDTHSPSPTDPCLPQLFEAQVERTPDAIAIVDGDRQLTFRQLNTQANRLAHYLQSLGVGPDTLVGLYFERSPEMIVSLLAIVKAGGAYLPLDPTYPQDRLAFMIQDAQLSQILSQSTLANQNQHHLLKNREGDVIAVDTIAHLLHQYPSHNPPNRTMPDNLAYVIYTSGSTGLPKGSMIPHRGLVNYLTWAKKTYLTDQGSEGGKVPLHSSLSFDLTVTSLFLSLLSGQRLVLILEDPTGQSLVENLTDQVSYDLLKLTPAHLKLLHYQMSNLTQVAQTLILGGEALHGTDLTRWLDEAPQTRVFNEYGPTETVVGCCVYEISARTDLADDIPIGRPIANTKLYILDRHLRPVPVGVPGELYIGGLQVGRGYLNRPGLTAEKFIPNPFASDEGQIGGRLYKSGDLARYRLDEAAQPIIEFLGRIDRQVKLRGFRIELGEIEAVLANHPYIENCSVDLSHPDLPAHPTSEQCVRCGLPANYPKTHLNENKVCNYCLEFEQYREQAQSYFKSMDDLQLIFDQAQSRRTGPYDCLMLLSGGKDSSYVLYQLVEMGLNVLAFSFDNGYISDGAKANINRIVTELKVDHVFGSTPAMNTIFVDSLQRFSNVCNGCFKVIYTQGVHLARRHGIKVIVTGLSRGQIFETRLMELFNQKVFDADEVDQTILAARKAYHRINDAVSQHLDVGIFQNDALFDDIQFVDFYRYTAVTLDEILTYLDEQAPWIRPQDTGRSTNCLINEVGIYVHQKERGYHNYAMPYSWDVRLGHKHRQAAIEELDDNINEANVSKILDKIGYRRPDAAASANPLVAYYSAPTSLENAHLRQYLADFLPDYMLPVNFIQLDHLPLTPNGKVDREALQQLQTEQTRDIVPPRTPTEQALADVWTKVLRKEQVSIHDNYFRLGGDSIMSIQIVAQAKQLGIDVSVKEIFEHQTIARLAQVAKMTTGPQPWAGSMRGSVPLTPIQQWFFEQTLPEAHHYNQAVVLDIAKDVVPKLLIQALSYTFSHHAAFRLRFLKQDGWQQSYSHSGPSFPVVIVDLASLTPSQRTTMFQATAGQLQASLHLSDGPLLRIALFRHGDTAPDQVLVIIHHLIVDGVSWRILLEDLQQAYQQLTQQADVILPPPSSSFQQWAERLSVYAQSKTLKAELNYWLEQPWAKVTTLPTDLAAAEADNTVASAATISTVLDKDQTRMLLQVVPSVYHTQINDLLLAALWQTVSDWQGQPTVLIDLEGHGREELFEGIDLSRTVGWFTSIFPIVLHLEPDEQNQPGKVIKSIKEQIRAIPNRGVGYGVLRYLNEDKTIRAGLVALPSAEILFNYLGQTDPTISQAGLFKPTQIEAGPSRSPLGRRGYVLEINSMIVDEQLQVTWRYSRNIHRAATIENLAHQYMNNLSALIEHCRSPQAGGYTPSDFPFALLAQQDVDRLAGILSQQVDDMYALSPLQQGMLFHSFYDPEADVYFQQLSFSLEGRLHEDAFKVAWQALLERQPVLRTSFVWEGLPQPVQLVRRGVQLPWSRHDWRNLAPQIQQEQLTAYLQTDRKQGLRLDQPPLMRCTLIRLDEQHYHFILSLHQLLLDGWSMPLLFKELFRLYQAALFNQPVSLPPARPYRDYIGWLQQQDNAQAETFWRSALRGFVSPTTFPTDRAAGTGLTSYREQVSYLPTRLSQNLSLMARKHHLTLNTFFQGAWALLLSRYSGTSDVLFGVTVSGRPPELTEVEAMVGLFINTLPARVQIAPNTPLLRWLQQLQLQQRERESYAYSSLVDIQGWSEIQRGRSLFDTVLIFENYPVDLMSDELSDQFHIKDTHTVEQTNYPLTILVIPDNNSVTVRFSYNTTYFKPETIARVADYFQVVLEGMVTHLHHPLRQLPLLSEQDRHRLLVEWNDTQTDYPQNQLLHQCIETQAERTPEAVAVVFETEHLTYQAVNRRANRLAHYLQSLGVGPEVLVGVYLDRSPQTAISLLAILKAGGAYLPLDPAYPQERLAFMVADAQLSFVIRQSSAADDAWANINRQIQAQNGQQPATIDLDAITDELNQQPTYNPISRIKPDNLAYVIYTSGSTGRPKGVMVEHQAILNMLHWLQDCYPLTHDDVVAQKTPLSFTDSVCEYFWPLMVGAKMAIIDTDTVRDPHRLYAALADHRVSLTQFVPPLIAAFLQVVRASGQANPLPHLKWVFSGGEALPAPVAREWYRLFKAAKIANIYGMTESVSYVTNYLIDREPDAQTVSIPMGQPLANATVYILDQAGQICPIDVMGEIHIGGFSMARGYLYQPGLTAEKFIPNPFSASSSSTNGEEKAGRLYKTGDLGRYRIDQTGRPILEYLGRLDHQVQIRGMRVELGEVEAVLEQYQTIQRAVVLAREEDGNDRRLVAYVVAEAPAGIDERSLITDLREFLKQKLPDYMIPAAFVVMETLPLTPSGKVDRKALPAPEYRSGALYKAPTTATEDTMAGIWQEILNLEQVGLEDNFFDLGGHSLLATQLMARVRHTYRIDLPLRSLFEKPTLLEIAQHIDQVIMAQKLLEQEITLAEDEIEQGEL
ncbi:MAG: amino acid adenylation domain-containing protein [Anaerolineae bacterium]|nr:amino acid adenylation domain-containing protein [Anaerolineae bacterium]